MSDPPRRRGHMTTITVLSIDGGGIRGLIPAAFLDQLEQRTGRHVFELFDYVAGTSTGGILALGLGANRPAGQAPYTARELVGLYQAQGPRIFSRRGRRRPPAPHAGTMVRVGGTGPAPGPRHPRVQGRHERRPPAQSIHPRHVFGDGMVGPASWCPDLLMNSTFFPASAAPLCC